MPTFKCKDIGMEDSFEVKDDNRDELMEVVALHARKSHDISEISPEMKEKIEKAIKE